VPVDVLTAIAIARGRYEVAAHAVSLREPSLRSPRAGAQGTAPTSALTILAAHV
jgi:hypothetical protein